MSQFSDHWSARQPQLDAVFAETIRLLPMTLGTFGPSLPDPDRAVCEVPAIITEKPERMHAVGSTLGRDFSRDFVVADTVASIDRAQFGEEIPRPADRVVAVERPDAPVFEIVAVESDGLARVLLSLVRVPS